METTAAEKAAKIKPVQSNNKVKKTNQAKSIKKKNKKLARLRLLTKNLINLV